MSKGSTPAGNTTTTQTSTPFNASTLTNLYNNATSTYNANSTPNSNLTSGYQDLIDTGKSINDTLRPATNDAYTAAIDGSYGYTNSPSKNYLSSVLNGDYLNSNPYLDKTYDAAADSVKRTYMTATAPQTDSAAELGGRYGSGALSDARSVNEDNLGTSLDKLSADIYGGNYENERSLQNTAASTAQTGYDTGNKTTVSGLALGPSILTSNYQPAEAEVSGGQGLTSANYTPLELYDSLVGTPVTGTTTTTQPYFSNSTANTLSSLTGGVGLLGGILNLF